MSDTPSPWYRRLIPGKKMIAAAAAIAVQFIPYLSQDAKEEVRNIVIGFIVGQGIADAGKERALVEARR